MILLFALLWILVPFIIFALAFWALSGKKKTGIDVIDNILNR